MRMHSFTGATSREVLQKVKQALGDDALILSNREVAGRIEVLAVAASEAMTSSGRAQLLPRGPTQNSAPEPVNASAMSAPGAAPRAHPGQGLEGILKEIQTLKTMLKQDVAAFAPEVTQAAIAPAPVLRELLNAGFTPELARRLVAAWDDGPAPGIDVVTQRLQKSLKLAPADELIDAGGVYALVGPTGVGKTTTVAKLAARAVVRFGASKVALLTTDSYRIGAYDQLRIYARILGIAVHAVRDASDLVSALDTLSDRHLVLIDTIGMSQRDALLAEQAATLAAGERVKRLVLVQATTNTATLDQIVRAYLRSGVDGCILTKIDEAASLAPALDTIIRHELPLYYVTDGQRVPEDLRLPDAAALVREALCPARTEATELTSAEAPLLAEAPVLMRAPEALTAMEVAHTPMPKVLRPLGRHRQARVVHG